MIDLLLYQSGTFWCLAVLGVFLTGVSKSGFAGGVGVMAVPMMAVVVDPKLAAAVMLPLLILMDAFNVKVYWRRFRANLLKPLLLGALLGIVVGTITFRYLEANAIKGLVGIIGLWFSLKNLLLRMPEGERESNSRWSLFLGSISGFTSYIAHAGGPPLNGYLLRLQLPKIVYLGTANVFFAVVNLVKLPAYVVAGQFNTTILVYSLCLVPMSLLGVWAGFILKDYFSEVKFRLFMNVALLLTSLYLVSISLFRVLSL